MLLFLPVFLFSQHSKAEIDSLKAKVFQLRKDGKLKDAFVLSKRFLQENENSLEKKDLVSIYIQTGNILSNLSRIKESFSYLELALKENEELQDKILESRIYGEYGRNYKELGFHQKATEYYTKGIDLLKHNTKPKNLQLQYLYSIRGVIYEEHGRLDFLYKDLHSAFQFYPDTYSASRLAKYFIVHKKNLDSAKYYLKKGDELFESDKTPIFQKSVLLRIYGRLYFEEKDYDKAISCYKESLLISQTLNKPIDIRDTNKLLYKVYKAINDDKRANQSLEKYTNINDSLSFEHKKIQETPIKHILKDKEQEVTKKEENYLFLIIFIFIITALIICFVLKRISKSNNRQRQEIILKNEEQTQELKLKVNESFEEVIQLAKTNSPEFWGRFQEVYPNFRSQILNLNPELKPSELILCAYIYLGFTTKDIADYTFKAVKTIKNNKYNLRKRLSIPTENDFTIWMRDFIK